MVIVHGRRKNIMGISMNDLIQIECMSWKDWKELLNFKIYVKGFLNLNFC